jgi:CubicO group peptidase (beta-lactamase class C family)
MQSSGQLSAGLNQALDRALEEQRVVGAVLLVARGGKIVYERAVGSSDRDAGRPMRADDLFRYSSLTKPIVTAAALALVARGKLKLEDETAKWLPEFRPKLPDGSTPAITIKQLLTHTSGLNYSFAEPADGPYHRARVSDGMDQPGLSMEENLRRIASAPLICAPGTEWHYSVSLDVLGAVLERVTGKPLPEVTTELVTGPLGMRDTAFRVVDRKRLAAAYVDGRPPQPMSDPQTVPFPPGAGIVYSPSRAFDERSFPAGGVGMVGTAPDMLRFLECIRSGGDPILPRELAASMMQNQIGDLPILIPGFGFGYGGAVLRDPAATQTPQNVGAWRWGGVYGHTWFVDPKLELTNVLMTNTALEGMVGQLAVDVLLATYAALK